MINKQDLFQEGTDRCRLVNVEASSIAAWKTAEANILVSHPRPSFANRNGEQSLNSNPSRGQHLACPTGETGEAGPIDLEDGLDGFRFMKSCFDRPLLMLLSTTLAIGIKRMAMMHNFHLCRNPSACQEMS